MGREAVEIAVTNLRIITTLMFLDPEFNSTLPQINTVKAMQHTK